MKKYSKYYFLLILLSGFFTSLSQNETKKWYFGTYAGLDFASNPPTILTNGAMSTFEGCSSISDAAGNLLFYTNGVTVWDKTHGVMANGTGLQGNTSSGQTGVIVKQPGNSNIYFVFSQAAGGGGLKYSTVDITLSAGNGSVTVLNTALTTPCTEQIASAKHCNGIDIWILVHQMGSTSNNFHAFLVTATGVNSTPVTSAVGANGSNQVTCMKVSPNGKQLVSGAGGSPQLFDFDNSTGVVSNPLSLGTTAYYGCEFSPDGTKLYADSWSATTIYQWDLCAGSSSAVANSSFAITTTAAGQLQLASDGKIYVAHYGQQYLGVINNPNAAGASCNYVDNGQSIAPKSSQVGLPNFISSYFKPVPPPFTYTVSNSYGCQGAAFTMPPTINTSTVFGCIASGYSVTGQTWIFGDPGSGSNNISFLANPIHGYTSLGTYTAMLVINYSCGGGSDTIKQTVVINQPCISVSSTSITCANLGSATVAATGGIGPFSYTWMPTAQTNSVATGLSPGSYTLTVFDYGNNYTYTANTVFTSLVPLTGSISTTDSITCNGASTGTANVTNLAGGSGNPNYAWFNGLVTHTVSNPSNLSAGLWTIVVSDAITGCTISQVFYISQPPPLNLFMSANTPTACAGTDITLTGTTSGGTPYSSGPSYSYTWSTGLASNTRTVNQSLAGPYVYTLNSQDAYSCSVTNTISVDFIANPVISIANVSICPLQTGTLTANGANTYTWVNSSVSNIFTDNPLVSTQYSLIGSALGCTATASASIILKPIPSPIINSNAPICNGQNLNLFGNIVGNAAATYNWTGPLSFVSTIQYPSISNATPNNSGTYNYTVTAANGCTASTSATLAVNPTPSVSASGSTVCVNQTLLLFSNASAATTYTWSGPGFTSNNQNPSIVSPSVSATGIYTVKVSSAAGCTNIATTNASVTAMPVPIALNNSPKCFGSTLNLNSSGGDAYHWYGPNGFNSLLQNPLINNLTVPAGGIYTLVITRGPCTNSTISSVTVNPLPTFTLNANSPCVTKTFSLFTSPVVNVSSYIWQGPNLFHSPNQNPTRDSSEVAYAGIYTLTVIDLNTCVDSRTIAVSILENPTLTALSTTVCLNESAILIAEGAQDYLWSGPNFYQSSQQNALITKATSSAVSIYTLVGTAPNNCTTTITASLTTNRLPIPSLSVSPKSVVCLNSQINIEGFGGEGYEWLGPDNFMYRGKLVTFTASSLSYGGTYTLIVTDTNSCRNSISTLIQIDPLPQGNLLGTNTDACIPFSSEFNFVGSQSALTEWTINSSLTKSGKNFSLDFKVPGTYTIIGRLSDTVTSCKNTLTFLVHARELPQADFSYAPELPVENMDEVLFTNTSKGEELTTCNWYFISNEGYSSTQNITNYLFANAGNYPVALVAKNKWNCTDTIVKNIKIEVDFNLYIPNAFTPNADNLNEVFKPVVRGVTHYEFSVFNRWGEKLFFSQDTTEGWDGSFEGKVCKSDIYIWKVILTTNKNEQKTYNGHVTLYR